MAGSVRGDAPRLRQVPQPIACLTAAIKTSRELVVHTSVDVDAAWATAVLKAADGTKSCASTWIFRSDRKAIRKDASAMVLVGNAASATQDAEQKKDVKDKIIRRRALLASSSAAAAKAKAKTRLSRAVQQAKTLRGTSVTLEDFATQIANFV